MSETTVAGIVLKREDAGESDRRLTVLTREFGKTTVYAKGAKKPGSRLAGVTDPLTFARFQLASGRKRKFLTQAQAVSSHVALRADYARLVVGLAMAELVAEALPYDSPGSDAFDLLALGLDQLSSDIPAGIVLAWFAARLLESEGHMPDWTKCAVTGRTINDINAWVSASAGGCLCYDEAVIWHDSFRASGESLIGIAKVAHCDLPPANLKRAQECLLVLHRFWQAGTGSQLRAFEAARTALAEP